MKQTDTEPDSLPTTVESVNRELPDPYNYDFGNTKLEPEHFDLSRRVLASGGSKQLLARILGVGYTTVMRWFNRGERDLESDTDSRWSAFAAYANTGLAAFEAEQISKVKNPEWLLERRFPESWGKKSKQDITVSQGQQYERAENVSKEQKDFLQKLAGGGIDPDERETEGDAMSDN